MCDFLFRLVVSWGGKNEKSDVRDNLAAVRTRSAHRHSSDAELVVLGQRVTKLELPCADYCFPKKYQRRLSEN